MCVQVLHEGEDLMPLNVRTIDGIDLEKLSYKHYDGASEKPVYEGRNHGVQRVVEWWDYLHSDAKNHLLALVTNMEWKGAFHNLGVITKASSSIFCEGHVWSGAENNMIILTNRIVSHELW